MLINASSLPLLCPRHSHYPQKNMSSRVEQDTQSPVLGEGKMKAFFAKACALSFTAWSCFHICFHKCRFVSLLSLKFIDIRTVFKSSKHILVNNSTWYCYSKKLGTRIKLGPEYYPKSGVVTRLELYSSYDMKI